MFLAGVLLALQITGSEFSYTVKAKDSWLSIAANVGVDARVLASTNDLKTGAKLKAGQILKVDNRHIVPSGDDVDIVINIPQRLLFHMVPEGDPVAYPISAGKADWKTPRGPFSILTKEVNPAWDVPVSIQEEMRRAGKPVVTRVPPKSPKNPLGGYWIGLSLPGIGIHGTIAPTSVYRLRTHGCIRVGRISELFSEVSVGMTGRVIYEPVLVARIGDSVFVEVHPDIYKKGGDPLEEIKKQAFTKGVDSMLDLAILKEVIQKREGIARDVTLH